MGRAIFISYRRDDTEGEAGRLYDDLSRSFGENSVFMDVAGINPGADFRKAIDDNVASCGVLLAVIGPTWATITGGSGARRLDDPNDFVRLEIASALAREIAVIPVLVHDAKMPRPEDLPENLKDFAFRNSVEVTHTRWNSDVQLLTEALKRYVAPTAASDTAPVHATVAVQLPPPTPPKQKEPSARPYNLSLVLGVVAAVVVALGIVGFLMFRPHSNPMVGTWTNPNPYSDNGVVKLEVSADAAQSLTMHAWGLCGQSQCDWGTQPATVNGQQAQATWQVAASAAEPLQRTALVVIAPDNGQLSVTITNSWANRASNQHQFTFVKAQ